MSIGFIKQALNVMQQQSRRRTPHRVNQWFKWLSPGLSVKRWFLISVAGIVLAGLGLAIWSGYTPIYWVLKLVRGAFSLITNIIPSYISGPIVMIGGLLLLVWGQSRTVGSITQVLKPGNDEELVDVLLAHRKLYRGPKIVVIRWGNRTFHLIKRTKNLQCEYHRYCDCS